MRFKRHSNSVFQHNWFQISFLPITNICLTLPAPDTILAESPKRKCSYSGAEKGMLQSPPPPSVPQAAPGLLHPPHRDMMCWSLTHTGPLPLLGSPLNLKSHSSASSLKSVVCDIYQEPQQSKVAEAGCLHLFLLLIHCGWVLASHHLPHLLLHSAREEQAGKLPTAILIGSTALRKQPDSTSLLLL